jgi:predicted N-formylglutamate amidohydrolase
MKHASFEIRREQGSGPFVIVCDHATNYVPGELANLGLTEADLARHIAWDIGAAAIADILSERFDSPAIFSGTSRLVVDCNRQLDAADLIPEVSDGTIIPGNQMLSEAEREARVQDYFVPYHAAIEKVLSGRQNVKFLSVHSMTECMRGSMRQWPVAFSSSEDRSLVAPLIETLRRSGEYQVGDNEPYNLDPSVDYSTPQHAMARGLPHIQVEFRQDEVGTEAGQKLWAGRFGDALETAGLL